MSYQYVTRLLDLDRNPVGYAPHQVSTSITRRINQATEVSVTVPRTRDPALRQGAFIQRVRVRSDGTEEIVGTARVSSRELRGVDQVTYSARLDAALLENNVTPANYGPALSDQLLEDLVRSLVQDWRIQRATIASPLESNQVDLVTEPGRAMIAKQANGRYYSSGFIVYRFDANNVDGWEAWDRIRWESDYFDSVSTTIQWRHGNDTGAMSTWSDPVQGADPTQTGVAIAGITSRFVDVRINLATSDTTTPQDTPEGVSPTVWGFTPRVFGLELISRTAGPIQIGTLDIEPHVFAREVSADRANALRILVDQCEATGHEFTVTDGVLNVARQVGSDRTNDFVLRAGSNVEVRNLRDQDSDLVNRLHAYGAGAGLQQLYVFREDAASVALYGPYEATESFDESSLVGLTSAADAFLAERAHPIAQFQITGPDEHALGLGDRVRIADPANDVVVTTRVTELTESESAGRGRTISAHLGTPPISLVDSIIGQAGAGEADNLALIPPLVQVRKTAPGFEVEVTHAPRSRGVGFRVHYSTVSGFTPSVNTQRGEGNQTLFPFPRAEPGALHYVRVASVDRHGNTSAYTPEFPIRAGHVETAQLGPGAVRENNIDDGAVSNRTLHQNALGTGSLIDTGGVRYRQSGSDRLILGNIAGLPGVPSGYTQGLWGALGTGVFIQGAPRVLAAGRIYANQGQGSTPPNGGLSVRTWPEVEIHGPISIPAGRTVIAVTAWAEWSLWDNSVPQNRYENMVVTGLRAFLFGYRSGGSGNGPTLTGSYQRIVLRRESVVMNLGSSSRSPFLRSSLNFLLIEVDVTAMD